MTNSDTPRALVPGALWTVAGVGWLVGEAVSASAFPGYSYATNYISDLGVPDVSAVGMRLGATLAACQAAASAPFHSLVLWDPCLSGRTFLREGEALFVLGEDDGRVHTDGLRHTPGFQYDAATASAMRSVDLARIPADQRLAVSLRYFGDRSLEEIAELTGERTGTVKSRLHYGLQALRAAYDAAGRLPGETCR